MVRFVDNIFGVALVGGEDGFSENEWRQFEVDSDDYDIFKWDVNEPSSSINFLDLTIEIEDGKKDDQSLLISPSKICISSMHDYKHCF